MLTPCADRTFQTNIGEIESPVHSSLHTLVQQINPNIFIENMPEDVLNSHKLTWGTSHWNDPFVGREIDHATWYDESSDLYQAIDLMKRCLTLDCTKRITAKEALDHPFIEVSWRPSRQR